MGLLKKKKFNRRVEQISWVGRGMGMGRKRWERTQRKKEKRETYKLQKEVQETKRDTRENDKVKIIR